MARQVLGIPATPALHRKASPELRASGCRNLVGQVLFLFASMAWALRAALRAAPVCAETALSLSLRVQRPGCSLGILKQWAAVSFCDLQAMPSCCTHFPLLALRIPPQSPAYLPLAWRDKPLPRCSDNER